MGEAARAEKKKTAWSEHGGGGLWPTTIISENDSRAEDGRPGPTQRNPVLMVKEPARAC